MSQGLREIRPAEVHGSNTGLIQNIAQSPFTRSIKPGLDVLVVFFMKCTKSSDRTFTKEKIN